MNGIERVFREVRRYDRKVENAGQLERGKPLRYGVLESTAGWAWISGAPDGFVTTGVNEDGYPLRNPVYKLDRIYVEWTKRGAVTYARRESDNMIIDRRFEGRSIADQVIAMIRGEL